MASHNRYFPPRAIYLLNDAEFGLWSAPASVTVGGRGRGEPTANNQPQHHHPMNTYSPYPVPAAQPEAELPPRGVRAESLTLGTRGIYRTARSAVLTLILGLALSAGFAVTARALFIVSPGAQTSIEGDGANAYPFNLAGAGRSSQRYQQVYNSSSFAVLGGPALITQIAFRPDAIFGAPFSKTLPNVRIDLSTTSLAADGLSSTFASNVGGNDAIVFSGALALSSAFTGPAGGPKDFDILINLNTPFLYIPGAGNLLLDVRNIGGGSTTTFDTQNTAGDAVSRAVTVTSGVNSATADFTDTFGLVTRFTATPAPEPTTCGLLGLGALLLAARRRRA